MREPVGFLLGEMVGGNRVMKERFSRINRRRLFTAAGAAVLSLGLPRRGWAAAYPFTLGVASGEPAPGGIVLWTRLAPEPLSPDPQTPGGMPASSVPMRWEIAEDEGMSRIVQSGTVDALPEFAHAVHVEVAGLAAGQPYWYRFIAAGETSPIGHTRTAPAAGAPFDRLRFAFASCANYELGWFSAYRHLAAENPDLVVFLGDYIYEFVSQFPNKVRQHSDGVEATDLRTYRNRMRSTAPTRICRPCMRRRRVSPPGTTMKSRTTTPT